MLSRIMTCLSLCSARDGVASHQRGRDFSKVVFVLHAVLHSRCKLIGWGFCEAGHYACLSSQPELMRDSFSFFIRFQLSNSMHVSVCVNEFNPPPLRAGQMSGHNLQRAIHSALQSVCNRLVVAFFNCIQLLQPGFVVMEQVPVSGMKHPGLEAGLCPVAAASSHSKDPGPC